MTSLTGYAYAHIATACSSSTSNNGRRVAEEAADFFDLARVFVRRVSLMNAHVACLHTALLGLDEMVIDVTALTPNLVFPMSGYEASRPVTLPTTWLAEVWAARDLSSYDHVHEPMQRDWRLRRGEVVNKATVERSFEMLGELLSNEHADRLVPLSELLVRSAAAYREHDYSQALILAWAVIEAVMQEAWGAYLDDNHTRIVDGTEASFITPARKKRLEGMNASLMTEMLSIVDRIPHQLYKDIDRVRGQRNKWIHDLGPVSADDASLSLSAAQHMIYLVDKIFLSVPLSLGISG